MLISRGIGGDPRTALSSAAEIFDMADEHLTCWGIMTKTRVATYFVLRSLDLRPHVQFFGVYTIFVRSASEAVSRVEV